MQAKYMQPENYLRLLKHIQRIAYKMVLAGITQAAQLRQTCRKINRHYRLLARRDARK